MSSSLPIHQWYFISVCKCVIKPTPSCTTKWSETCTTAKPSSSPPVVSTRDVNLIGQDWGQTAIDWLVIRRERPGGSIGADTVNTELRRVERSLTNGHQPTGTQPLTHQLPAIPYCQAGVWVKGCGVWWYWSLDKTLGNCIGDKFTIRVGAIFSSERGAWSLEVLSSERLKNKSTAQENKDKCNDTCVITSLFFCILHFVSHHSDTLTPFVWNLQRFKEIKHFPKICCSNCCAICNQLEQAEIKLGQLFPAERGGAKKFFSHK